MRAFGLIVAVWFCGALGACADAEAIRADADGAGVSPDSASDGEGVGDSDADPDADADADADPDGDADPDSDGDPDADGDSDADADVDADADPDADPDAADVGCSPGCGPGEVPACAGVGAAALVLQSGGGGALCAGAEAQNAFRWGLCACEDAAFSNAVTVDAFDSRAGPFSAGGAGGGLGANGVVTTTNRVAVSGDLFCAGAAGLTAYNTLTVGGALALGGPLVAYQRGDVGADALVWGDLTAYNGFDVGGTLRQPAGATVTGALAAGARAEAPAPPQLPCRCETKALALPTALAAAHAPPNNDNGAIGLAADALLDPPGAVALELPCGLFYLDGVRSGAPVTITATGRGALFIGGDVRTSGPLTIATSADGELDVYVAGTIEATGALALGAEAHPARLRVYVGGTEPVVVSNSARIAAFLQAGRAEVSLGNHADVFGGVVARRLVAPNVLTVHYDRAVLAAAAGCPDDAQICASCADCEGQACVAGTCGPCGADADCCDPLRCRLGRCEPP
ncbi:MAG: hypothetical protein H6745_33125 [Deltaproteobacteria bacterium]|nr:hypothetical protein [Deltaproteobacteria bacterium]